MSRQIESLRAQSGAHFDAALEAARAELMRESGTRGPSRTADPDGPLEALRGTRPLESLGAPGDGEVFATLEAIVLAKLRPPYLVLGDEIEIDGEYDRVDLIEARKDALETTMRGVGRIDLFHHSTLSYGGTGWLIEDDLAVTNRHVARLFAEEAWDGRYRFRDGAFDEPMEARLDYVRQHEDRDVPRRRAEVLAVLYIAGDREPDIAFLKVDPRDDTVPLELATGKVEAGAPVAAVGYPAWDGNRNDPALMKKLFRGIYDVKRFSPGLVTGRMQDDVYVLSDYTSLGGNSGSPVLDLETGKAVGLHFAGAFRETNYAVAADIVAAARARIKTMVAGAAVAAEEAPTTKPETLAGRDGYDPGFLGCDGLAVPLPGLGQWADDIAPVSDHADGHLKYRHFTVLQSKSRRLPLLTACNIDGAKSFRLKRTGDWRLDGRLAEEHQVGNVLYTRNPLDRGHMVRRRDPGWGASRDEAQEAELDTFHYTNAVPQHANLNRKDWVGLEDYVLEAAETKDFKVSVFTGPILRDDDPHLRDQPGVEDVAIPEEFWKVAVMVHAGTGKLSATGYVLTHGKMLRDLVEAAFVLGQYETYQIQIARIEAETGLDFGPLRDHDPLGAEVAAEAPFAQAVRRVEGAGSLRL